MSLLYNRKPFYTIENNNGDRLKKTTTRKWRILIKLVLFNLKEEEREIKFEIKLVILI